jgi:hypothetical protein
MGIPLNYSFIDGFSINHPAIGVSNDYDYPIDWLRQKFV